MGILGRKTKEQKHDSGTGLGNFGRWGFILFEKSGDKDKQASWNWILESHSKARFLTRA